MRRQVGGIWPFTTTAPPSSKVQVGDPVIETDHYGLANQVADRLATFTTLKPAEHSIIIIIIKPAEQQKRLANASAAAAAVNDRIAAAQQAATQPGGSMRGTMNRVLRKLGLMPKRSTSASRRPATKKPTSASKTRHVPLQRPGGRRRRARIMQMCDVHVLYCTLRRRGPDRHGHGLRGRTSLRC